MTRYAPRVLSPGDKVDRYTIVTALGQGGMGAVYHARDEKLHRDVALKILHLDDAIGTEGAAKIVREARAW
jgi:serine/threonine protein kinase